MAKKKKQAPDGPIRARDTEVNYYTVCGLMFLLGMIVFFFMIYLCFRARRPGSTQMLILLDCVEAVLLIYLLLSWRQLKRILGRRLGYSRAAVDRHPDGSARLEFPVGSTRYCLDVPKEQKIEGAGMVNVWYDPVDPRNCFFGQNKPEKASPFGIANFGLLLTLTGILNLVFFLFLR